MREIHVDRIAGRCAKPEANYVAGEDVRRAFTVHGTGSRPGQQVLEQILENMAIAEADRADVPDTGTVVVFAGSARRTSSAAIRRRSTEASTRRATGYLKSMVERPSPRGATRGTTRRPSSTRGAGRSGAPVILAKGGGAENMSRLAMLTPAHGREGIVRFVLETVQLAGPNACPPVVVGVGIGATFDRVATLAKQALLREIGSENPDPEEAELEAELLAAINRLGIGPHGFGGRITALAVHVVSAPCHIASLPVAVNLQCGPAARHREVEI